MSDAPTSKTSLNHTLERAEAVLGALGDVFARSFAVYTVELLQMLDNRGLEAGMAVRPKTGKPGVEDGPALAPEWVREAAERAKASGEAVDGDERKARGRLIRNRLALALKKQRKTQSDLAREMGKHPSHVSRVLRNPERCQLSTLVTIADALGADVSDILRGFPDPESEPPVCGSAS